MLIVEDIHRTTLHGGTQLMLNIVRKSYWNPRARQLVKKITHDCVTCVRQKGEVVNQIMADLPMDRITPSRPFLKTGVGLLL